MQGWDFYWRALQQRETTCSTVPCCWRNDVRCKRCTCNFADLQWLSNLQGDHHYDSSEYKVERSGPWWDWTQNDGQGTWHWHEVKAGILFRSMRTSAKPSLWKNRSCTWKVLDQVFSQKTQKKIGKFSEKKSLNKDSHKSECASETMGGISFHKKHLFSDRRRI